MNNDETPRRYEVRDAETGEKLLGVSFILTPTGEEMRLLSDEKSFNRGKVGIYLSGDLDAMPAAGLRKEQILKEMALYVAMSGALGNLDENHLKFLDEDIQRLKERRRSGTSPDTADTTTDHPAGRPGFSQIRYYPT